MLCMLLQGECSQGEGEEDAEVTGGAGGAAEAEGGLQVHGVCT